MLRAAARGCRPWFTTSPTFAKVHESSAAYCERARLRADSTLAQLSDEDFDRGLAALERAVADQAGPRPVEARIDLLVLR
jgi:hypothetical protein